MQSALVGELRTDFRAFRANRIVAIEFLPERYPQERGRRLVDYLATIRYRRMVAAAGEAIA